MTYQRTIRGELNNRCLSLASPSRELLGDTQREVHHRNQHNQKVLRARSDGLVTLPSFTYNSRQLSNIGLANIGF